MPRLFVAIDISNKRVINTAIKAQDVIRRSGVRATYPDPSQLHITLKFIGEVDETTSEYIKNALSKISYGRFSIKHGNIGAFPNLNRPRVIFIDVENNSFLQGLYNEVERKLSFLRIKGDKPFHPHITIARIKSLFGWNIRLVNELKSISIDSVSDEICEFKLKQSILRHTGPTYIDIMTYPLR